MKIHRRPITNPSKKIDIQKIFATRSDKKSIMVSAYVNGRVEGMEFKSIRNIEKAKDKFISIITRSAKHYADYNNTLDT
jgi:hypothetical protein